MRIGLVGNPNVGKSTIFNSLTGSHVRTGNWPGKTVEKCVGYKIYNGVRYEIEDLPGTYSLSSHSKEEEVTRDYVYFEDYDALIIVCDACALERNLNLVLSILEITSKVIICVNLVDEAKRKKIKIDFNKLEDILKVPVIPTTARSKKGICDIFKRLNEVIYSKNRPFKIDYDFLEEYLNKLNIYIPNTNIDKDIISLHLLLKDYMFLNSFDYKYSSNISRNLYLKEKVDNVLGEIKSKGVDDLEVLVKEIVSNQCMKIALETVKYENKNCDYRDRKIDRFLTGRVTGSIIMLLLLIIVLWITIVGANYPSDFLYSLFFKFEKVLYNFLTFVHVPSIVVDALVNGVYRVLSWVVAVMLPPMAIFFPLFTILEDLGYLPRIAFNLDGIYEKCGSCGKQALTMVEGFGCNAVGVTGARIIDSPRERLISILTNVFIPCNGRFPLLISLITMFLIESTLFGTVILTLFILFGIFITFIISKLLSTTILKGVPSSFTLELPPFRRPQVGKVIVRSVFDRTLFVLKRAVLVSMPAGLIIWVFANIKVGDVTLLKMFSNYLNPFANLIGLDGVILMAFILGFPANEIVIPIMIMGYMSLGKITDLNSIVELKKLFVESGWTISTAICTMIFSIMHFPCMTTLLTIKKETGSKMWTFLSFLIPTLTGIIICFILNILLKSIGI